MKRALIIAILTFAYLTAISFAQIELRCTTDLGTESKPKEPCDRWIVNCNIFEAGKLRYPQETEHFEDRHQWKWSGRAPFAMQPTADYISSYSGALPCKVERDSTYSASVGAVIDGQLYQAGPFIGHVRAGEKQELIEALFVKFADGERMVRRTLVEQLASVKVIESRWSFFGNKYSYPGTFAEFSIKYLGVEPLSPAPAPTPGLPVPIPPPIPTPQPRDYREDLEAIRDELKRLLQQAEEALKK